MGTPSAGPSITLGAPAAIKPASRRADFTVEEHDTLIEWHGYRLAWSRAAQCPCTPLNGQTEQADPSCRLCEGAGYLYFNSREAQDDALLGALSPVQQKIMGQGQARMIRGIMTGLGRGETPYDRLGRLPSGTANVTVRSQNRIGYLDRLVALDAFVVHTQRVNTPADPQAPLPLRYLVDGGVNLLTSATQRYMPDEDFVATDGLVRWLPGRGPEPGTWLSAHYNCHPAYLVTEQPHASRLTYIRKAKGGLATPEGTVVQMPLMASVRLDWLVGDETRGVAP